MRTATLTAKVNRWLHEHLAMKTPAKLLGGLALGALVMAATALPFGTTYADEPTRPLSSGQNPGYCEIDGSCYDPPLLGVLQNPGYCEIDGSCYDPPLLGVLPNPALVAGSPLASEQFEYWPEVGFDSRTYHRFMVEQGKVGRVDSSEQFEDWPEVGLDSRTYHRFMVEQSKVGGVLSGAKVDAEIDDVEAMAIYGYPASIFYALNEGKAGRRLSREQASTVEVSPVIDIGLGSNWDFLSDNEVKVVEVALSSTPKCSPQLQIC